MTNYSIVELSLGFHEFNGFCYDVEMGNTNWIVITGAPCSGKTSVIDRLKELGYQIEPEVARSFIEMLIHQHNEELLKEDILGIQRTILSIKSERERHLPQDKQIFFDRGLPDSIAYYMRHQLDYSEPLALCDLNRYHKVFIFERLPYEDDGIRQEDPYVAESLDYLIREAYHIVGYPTIDVPVLSIEDRVQFILDQL